MTALVLEWRKVERIATAWAPQPIGAAIPAAIIGPPGPSGAVLAGFEHVQVNPAAQWLVNHNLGRWPAAVTIVTVGGLEVEAAVTNISVAQLTIDLAAPFAGRARII